MASSQVPTGCLAPSSDGYHYTQGTSSGSLWTSSDGTSTINPPCDTSGVCFGNTITVSGTVREVPFAGCGYEWGTVWGVNVGWNLNQVGSSAALPANVTGAQSITIGLSGAIGPSLRVEVAIANPDGGANTQFCAPLVLNNGLATVPLTSLTTDCWQLGGTRFDPATMKPVTLFIQVVATTRQDIPFNFCVTQLKIE